MCHNYKCLFSQFRLLHQTSQDCRNQNWPSSDLDKNNQSTSWVWWSQSTNFLNVLSTKLNNFFLLTLSQMYQRQVAVVKLLYTFIVLPLSLTDDTALKNVSNAAYWVLLNYQTQHTQQHFPALCCKYTFVQLHYGINSVERCRRNTGLSGERGLQLMQKEA